jgi:ABC-type uncharacterized transport system involved in gliding motility auxiliary subunit
MMRWERRLALLSASIGVLLLFAGIGVAFVEGGLVPRASFLMLSGIALTIVYAVIDPAAVTELVRNRRARFGSMSVLVTAVVLGIIVAVNVVASRSTAATDLTHAGLYTLSPKSMLVTKRIDSDLVVTGFYSPAESSPKRQIQTLLNLYQQQSPHVKVRYVDPNQNGAQALSLGVKIDGSIVLQYKNRTPVVLNLASQSESDVSAAILRLESNRTPVVCWAAGDGERDLADTQQITGYSAASDLIKTNNYQVQDVLLAQQGVPQTCDVLVVLDLGRPLSDASVKSLQGYLAGGGKLLMAVGPWTDGKIVASVNSVLSQYGVTFDGGLVVEPDSAHAAAGDPTIPAVYQWGDSPITKDLAGKDVFFVGSTPIAGTAGGSATSVNLATTTSSSYSIAQQRSTFDRRASDKAGPFTILQSIEDKHPDGRTTRLLLSGTPALAENRTMPPNASGSNPDLLLSSLDWLTQQDSLIAIGPKPAAAGPLVLTDQDTRFNQVLTLGVLPLLVVVGGLLVLRRRRSA